MERILGRAVLWGVGAMGVAALARLMIAQGRRFELRDRVALVTGGSRGLGLVLARKLQGEGGEGRDLLARDEEELESARRDLLRHGRPVHAVPCDITDRAQVAELFRRVRSQLGRSSFLINNAGVISMGPHEEMTGQDYDLALRTHFWGPMNTTLEALPSMRRARSGRIVNIASIGGKVPVPHLAPYCTSKFALVGFSESLRAEVARDRVFITTVCPGLMRTGSHLNATFKGRHRAEYAWFKWAGLAGAVSAERAAARILRAAIFGEAEVIIGLTAAVAAKAQALMPEWTSDAMAATSRALPGPGGIGKSYAKGRDSESRWTRNPLMRPLDKASKRNNEMPARG